MTSAREHTKTEQHNENSTSKTTQPNKTNQVSKRGPFETAREGERRGKSTPRGALPEKARRAAAAHAADLQRVEDEAAGAMEALCAEAEKARARRHVGWVAGWTRGWVGGLI